MQAPLGQIQERATALRIPETTMPAVYAPTVKEIPYDYVAKFSLLGQRGNRVPQVINISTEGAFVAIEIAYSFIPAKLPTKTTPQVARVKAGLRSYMSHKLYTAKLGTDQLADTISNLVDDPRILVQSLMARFCGIDFLYSITDSGSGRELQNQPIPNIAGLGEATGQRPFRPLPKPMLFMPRSTIRIEVEEISEGLLYGYEDTPGHRVGAELYFVLHGYKMLGYGTG